MRDLKSGIKEVFLSDLEAKLGKIADENEKKEKREGLEKYLNEFEKEFDKEMNSAAMRLRDNLVFKLKSNVGFDFDMTNSKFEDYLKKIVEQFYKMNK